MAEMRRPLFQRQFICKSLVTVIRLIILIFAPFALNAQLPAVLSCRSSELAGKKIQIVAMADPVMGREEIVAEQLIPQAGLNTFAITVEKGFRAISIRSGEYSADVYLQMGDSADLKLDRVNFTWTIEKCTCLEVNEAIGRINAQVNNFFMEAYRKPGAPLPAKQTRYFADTLRKSFKDTTISYVADYLFFRTVYAELSANARSGSDVIRRYLDPAKVLTANPAWVDVFSGVFDGYFRQLMNRKGGDSLKQILQSARSVNQVLSYLNKDSLFSNPELTRLAVLKGIYETGNDRQFSRDKLRNFLDELKVDSSDQVRLYATQILERWNKLEKGQLVPDFSYMPFPEHKPKQFSAWKGKPVYLIYYPSFSQAFQKELLMLKAINERYKGEIAVLVIVDVQDPAGLSAALRKLNPGFEVAALSECSADFTSIPESLNLQTYILIDRSSRYWQAPAESPETGVEAAFQGLMKSK